MAKFLRTGLDPLKIFRHAVGFHTSYNSLLNSVQPTEPVEVVEKKMGAIAHPAMTLAAFSSELYLKCLLCVEKDNVPDDHNLKRLFFQLSEQSRSEIDTLWDSHIRQPAKLIMIDQIRKLPKGDKIRLDLRYALDVSANSFIELRYFYEKEQVFFLLSDFPQLLRIVILRRFPSWESILPIPSTFLTR